MVGILGANSVSGGYEIDNSLRFNDGDSPKLTFTPSGAGNRRTFTLSVWFKLAAGTTGERVLLAADDGTGDNNNFDYFALNPGDKLIMYGYEGGSENQSIITTQLLRDPSAWYHFVVAVDTTQGTAANRVKFYLNGSQITAFDTANYPSQNFQTRINNNNAQRISSYPDQDVSYFDGYMAEYHLVDGSAKAPSDFGETDDNGVWIPKAYTGSYGTNGFYLEFKETGGGQNSSGIGADTSGNDHHWAVTNFAATDVTTDTPTNNFCTFSPLQLTTGAVVLSEGNTLITMDGAANYSGQHGTIGVSNGKWYWEMKAIDSSVVMIGALTLNSTPRGDNTSDGSGNGMYYYYANTHYQSNETTIRRSNAGNGSLGNSAVSGGSNSVSNLSDNDIVQIALDMDNNKIYFGLNGTFVNSSNPADGTNSFTLHTDVSNPVSPYAGADGGQVSANFGNPSFAISSGNADANGYGNFEFAVPSGYYSLCTKNLAEFG